MPQGYDARESGNYKIVDGKRVALPTQSGNETTGRRGGERGPRTPKGTTAAGAKSTTGRKGNTSLRDMQGVPFNPDPANYDNRAMPISSIARDVGRREADFKLRTTPLRGVDYLRGIYKQQSTDRTHFSSPGVEATGRPYGKEGTKDFPSGAAVRSRRGANMAFKEAKSIGERGKRLDIDKSVIRKAQEPHAQLGRELREQSDALERDYTNKYVSRQTQRMRDMMGTRREAAKAAAPAPKSSLKSKTFGALLGITRAAGAMAKKKR